MGIWDRIGQETGVDPNTLSAFARIESGGNPANVTGSYKGLFQLSDAEFRKHGDPGANIFDPEANARAGARKYKADAERLAARLGRTPAPHEVYLAHQQGEGGAAAHWANPGAPAWINMASTAEGRAKGPGWAKAAIWGNVPDDVKARYGSVDNITSQQFTDMWRDKYARLSGEASASPTDITTQKIAQSLAAPSPGPSPMTASPMISATYDPNEMTPEAVALQRKIALGLLGQGSDISPVGHPLAALARAIQGGVGGYQRDTANEAELRSKRAENASLQSMLAAFAPRNDMPSPAPQAPTQPSQAQPASSPMAILAGTQRPALDGGGPRLNMPSNPTAPAIGVGAMPSANYDALGASIINDVSPTTGMQSPATAAQPGTVPKGPPAPISSSPLTVGQDTQSRDKQAEYSALTTLFSNPYIPRAEKMKALEDFKTKWSPTDEQRLNRRLAELKILEAEKNANDPSGKITVLPEGARAIVSDPRTGASRVIGQGGVKQTSTDKKAIYEAEDEIPALDSTINALNEAKRLNKLAYSGMTAGLRGSLGTSVGGLLGVASDAALATSEYQKIMNQQAIEGMSRTLKGATTDREMAQFVSIISDLNQPPDVRERAIDRLMQLAEKQRAVKRARIQELRGGEAPPVPPQATQAPSPQVEDRKEIMVQGRGMVPFVRINGQWHEAN